MVIVLWAVGFPPGLRVIDHGAEATGLVLALRIVDEEDDKIIEVRALLVP